MPARSTNRHERGFTLIEVLMAIAIVGILAAVAFPAYIDYMMRAKIAEATGVLANMRIQMEQYFQDSGTYLGIGGRPDPCTAGSAVPPPANTRYFDFACDELSATTYRISATGRAADGMGGFVFRVNQLNTQSTDIDGNAAAAGFVTNSTCWIIRKGVGANAC